MGESVRARLVGSHVSVEVEQAELRVDHASNVLRDCPSPSELLSVSLASCIGLTISAVAERKGYRLDTLAVRVSRDDVVFDGRQTSRFAVQLEIAGPLTERERNLLFHVAQHCHVHKLLTGPKEFSFDMIDPQDSGPVMPPGP